MHHQVNPGCFSLPPSQPHLLIDIIRRFTKVNDFGLIKLLALSLALSFLVWTYMGSHAWIDGSGRAYGGEGAIIGDDASAGGDDSISEGHSGVHSGVHNKDDPLQINFFEEIAQIFEEPSAHNEPSAHDEPSGYNDGESPDEGSFDAPLWDDPSEGSDSSLNYLGANSIAGSVMGTVGVVATRSPARTLLRGPASRGTHRWLIPGVVLGAGLGYLYKSTQRSQLHASLQGGRASVATPSASSYARASASASEPPSSSQSWIIQSPSPEDPRVAVADVEDDLVGLLMGGAKIMRALKKDHKQGQHILDTVMTHSSRYDFKEVSVYEVLTDAQEEENKRRYGKRDILTLKQATEWLPYMEGKLRELGVDPHSDPDGGWQKPASQNKWAEYRARSVLSDSFLDFGRNYVFETSSGEKLSREQFNHVISYSTIEKYSSLVDVEELIEAYFHRGNTPESIIDQNSLQEFNDYLTLDYRVESVVYPIRSKEEEYRKSLNDFVVHDPDDFFKSTRFFAENHGRPNLIWLALYQLRGVRKSLDTASDSDLSRSREAAQVSRVLKRLAKYKGVAFERLALIAEPTWRPEFVLVELLED